MFTYPVFGGGVLPAPVVESYALSNNGNATTDYLRMTMPSGIQAGDLLVMIAHAPSTSNYGVAEASPFGNVTGWSNIELQIGNSTHDSYLKGFWRAADGTEAAYYDIPWDPTAWRLLGVCWRISGADTGDPFDATLQEIGGSGASTFASASLTHSASNGLALASAACGINSNITGSIGISGSPEWSVAASQFNSGYGAHCYLSYNNDLESSIADCTHTRSSNFAGFGVWKGVVKP